jgi:hypothetical protein
MLVCVCVCLRVCVCVFACVRVRLSLRVRPNLNDKSVHVTAISDRSQTHLHESHREVYSKKKSIHSKNGKIISIGKNTASSATVSDCMDRPAMTKLTYAFACCLLPAACCLLPVACCLLPAACCLLPAACCLLCVACCLLPAACCLFSAVSYLLSAVSILTQIDPTGSTMRSGRRASTGLTSASLWVIRTTAGTHFLTRYTFFDASINLFLIFF